MKEKDKLEMEAMVLRMHERDKKKKDTKGSLEKEIDEKNLSNDEIN